MTICECADKGCPVHKDAVCSNQATENMRRVDMDDRTGVDFCAACALDAAESGVFA